MSKSLNLFKKSLVISSVLIASSGLTGCASYYIDNIHKDVESSSIQKISSPQPAQVFFEFQTDGTANLMGTNFLKDQVLDLVLQSGLISDIRDTTGADVGEVKIKIDNIPLTSNPAARGFLVGLSFGIAGTTVGDAYRCEMSYRPGPASNEFFAKTNHAIYTSLGVIRSTPQATEVASIDVAVKTMAKQCIHALLLQISRKAVVQN